MNLVSEKDCARIVGWALPIESDWNSVSTNNSWLKTDGIGIIFSTGDSDFQIDLIRLSNSMTKTFNALTGGSIGQIAAAYVFGDGAPDKTMSWLDYDRLGNVMGMSDFTGDQIASYHQDAYGNVLSSMNTGAWAASFSGRHLTTKEYDPDGELYGFGYRWFDSRTGLFRSKSPLSPDFEESYLFCHGNPTNFFDRSGLVPDHYVPWPIPQDPEDPILGLPDLWEILKGPSSCVLTDISHWSKRIREWMNLYWKPYVSPDPRNDGYRNAMQHCLWQCLLTQYCGEGMAVFVGAGHEFWSPYP